jgi:hypothetical protein
VVVPVNSTVLSVLPGSDDLDLGGEFSGALGALSPVPLDSEWEVNEALGTLNRSESLRSSLPLVAVVLASSEAGRPRLALRFCRNGSAIPAVVRSPL